MAVATGRPNPQPLNTPTSPSESSPLDEKIYYYIVLGKVFSAAAVGTGSLACYYFYYGMVLPYVAFVVATVALIMMWQVCSDIEGAKFAPASTSTQGTAASQAEEPDASARQLEEDEPIGFTNIYYWYGVLPMCANDCFVNSVLQGVLTDGELIQELRDIPEARIQPGKRAAHRALIRLFDQYAQDGADRRSVSKFYTKDLRALYPNAQDLEVCQQGDGPEFLRGIFNLFDEGHLPVLERMTMNQRYPRLFFKMGTTTEFRRVPDSQLSGICMERMQITGEQQEQLALRVPQFCRTDEEGLRTARRSMTWQTKDQVVESRNIGQVASRSILRDNRRTEILNEQMCLDLSIPESEEIVSGQELFQAHFKRQSKPSSEHAAFLTETGRGYRLDYYQQSAQQVSFIGHTPRRFYVTLKRFQFDLRTGHTRKIHTKIQMPLVLNSAEGPRELQWFVRHMGGAFGGHYVAYVKKPSGWWYISDTHKSRVNPEQLQDALQHGYLHFYKRPAPAQAAAE